jgi:hypothetical protein
MSRDDGRVFGTTKIVDHGPDNQRWNLVIVGDGYQASELDKYHQDVQNFVGTFQRTKPFDELFAGINVHRVDVVSTDSGADDPADCPDRAPPVGTGATANTFFDATFCGVGPGSQRLNRLLTIDFELALSIAKEQVSSAHQVLCVVNSSKYGGSGGQVATCSTNVQANQIAIHEMGHSAFGLADEYGGDGTGTPGGEPPQPNVTRDTDRNTNKWGNMILASTPMPSQRDPKCAAPLAETPPPGVVGTYEGGIFSDCEVYRPFTRCKMRVLDDDFCPVCQAVIRNTLQQFFTIV